MVGNSPQDRPPKVALVHDFLLDLRGAERTFAALCDIWPQADIFTAVYDEKGTEGRFAERNVQTSFLQRLRPNSHTFRALLPLYPAAVESFDLSCYDLVVSSSSAWAHGVLCDDPTVHVCYCYNPFRYAWNEREKTLGRQRNPVTRAFLRGAFRRWRQWDWIAAQRTNRYIACSRATQARIRAYFGRESNVVYPPVNTERFSIGPVGHHYAILSELMPHKQIALAVEAFNMLGRSLIVIGDGPQATTLRRIAGPTIRFAGRAPDATVAQILQGARALIVTSVEEFGIAALESQAAGRPVIARRAGGVLETIEDGVTGCFWSGGAAELADAVAGFDDRAIDPEACARNAERFGLANFREGILREVQAARAGGSRPDFHDRQPLRATRIAMRAAREVHR
jgi:glycosyltransferase involved in cell wall biosynthesis